MSALHFRSSGSCALVDKFWREHEGILKDFKQASDQVDRYLPLNGVSYFGYHRRKMWAPVGGNAPNGRQINLSFNPSAHPRFDRQALFPIYLAHERHHVLRHRGLEGYGYSFGESLVTEGLGVLAEFEMAQILGMGSHPLVQSYQGTGYKPYLIQPDKLPGLLDQAFLHLHMLKNKRLSIGYDVYDLGYFIVRQYQKEQGMPTAIDMAHIPAREVLKVTFGG